MVILCEADRAHFREAMIRQNDNIDGAVIVRFFYMTHEKMWAAEFNCDLSSHVPTNVAIIPRVSQPIKRTIVW